MVRLFMVEPTRQDLSPRLSTGARIFLNLFWASDDVQLVGGDVVIDYGGTCGEFINLKMQYWCSYFFGFILGFRRSFFSGRRRPVRLQRRML